MSNGLNCVHLIGRVGKEVEVKNLEGDVKVAKFTLAVSEIYKDKDGNKKENTTWINIVCWKQLAVIAEKYVKKGDPLYIQGKLQNREYSDKDGNKKYFTEIVVNDLKMLGGKKEGKADNEGGEPDPEIPEQTPKKSSQNTEPPDDLPF